MQTITQCVCRRRIFLGELAIRFPHFEASVMRACGRSDLLFRASGDEGGGFVHHQEVGGDDDDEAGDFTSL